MDRTKLSHERREDLKKDFKSAMHQTTRAQKEEELEECFQKSLFYFQYGLFGKALRLLKVLSGKGYAKAQYAIGWMYDDGLGVFLNSRKAQKWYKIASKNNSIEAHLAIAYDYRHGHGVEQDIEKAVDISKGAAQSGNATALFNLGFIYWDGIGRDQNIELAIEYFQKAANLYYPTALSILSIIWYRKKDVKSILDIREDGTALTYIDLLCHHIQMGDVVNIKELLQFILTITAREGTSVVDVLHSSVTNTVLDEAIYERQLQKKAPDSLIRFSTIKAHVYSFLRRHSESLVDFFCPKLWTESMKNFEDRDIRPWKKKHNIKDNECLKLFKKWLKSIELQAPQYYSSKNMCVEPWRFSEYSFEYNEHSRISTTMIGIAILTFYVLGLMVGYDIMYSIETNCPTVISYILIGIYLLIVSLLFIPSMVFCMTVPYHIDNYNLILSTERTVPRRILLKRLWEFMKKNIFNPQKIGSYSYIDSEPIWADMPKGYTSFFTHRNID